MASTTLRDYLQHTEDAISAGHIEDAQAQCQRILSRFPESLEAQRLLGEVYLAQGHLEDAQQTFDWILINDPENVIVYCDRALICERLSDLDTALDCYQQAYELSRGDSQIRQEFNKLSARAGQQGFMFSRAGLARLYMRGDLLPQAIQEWEVVLSANPERLDARAGLLEAYWRDGLYEQVEELATTLLNDVPGCLKALLLLAHVSSLKNMQQAQELLQRAEVLDPELVMAQELFSDLIASQPHDPFLQLLKKGPVVLTEQPPPHATVMTAPTLMESLPTHTNGSQSASTFSDSPLSSWSNLDTLISPQPQSEPEPDIPTFAWSSNSAMDINPWSTIDQLRGNSNAPTAEPQSELEVEHDAIVPAAEAQIEEGADLQSWSQAEQLAEPEAETFDSWSSISNIGTESSDSPWGTEAREESERSAPPAWLDMLTKGERRPASQPLSGVSSTQAASTAPQTPQAESEPAVAIPPTPSPAAEYMPWEGSPQMPALDDGEGEESNEASFFGPEWLKSLGASVIEEQTSSTPVEPLMPATSEEPAEPAISDYAAEVNANWQMPIDPWLEQLGQPQSHEPHGSQPSFQSQQTPIDPWMDAGATAAREAGIEAPQHATEETLETLERELYTQGFVPLEPGSLATIAEDEALSSALSQLGSFESHEPMAANQLQPAQLTEAAQPVQSAQTRPLAQPAETIRPIQPVQSAQIGQSVVPFSEPVEEPLWLPTPAGTPDSPVSKPAPVSVAHVEIQSQLQPQREQSEAVANFSSPPEPMTITTPRMPAAPKAPAAGTTMPSVGNDILLDSELEMTMRRPVVRLQPVAKPIISQGHATPISRARTSATSKAGDSHLSYKERLLKGYHYQLAGDYDEAMQEYRIIIRNAPELLGEVISNMRALLKLASKYAPGYRVLGDAYMRQGEYLQAMEAYNKALMMAKKGQGTR